MSSGVQEAIAYGFPVGRVRVLEGRLLDDPTLERLIDARDFEDQKRVLGDTVYAGLLADARTPEEVEEVFEDEIEEVFLFLERSGVREAVVRYFRVPYDFANLRARLKAEALGASLAGLLVRHGIVERAAFEQRDPRLPAFLADVEARIRADGVIELEDVDILVDRALFGELGAYARAARSSFLEASVELAIDLANVKTMLRRKALDRPLTEARAGLLTGGRMAPNELMRYHQLPPLELAQRLTGKAALADALPRGVDELRWLDVLVDVAMLRHAQRARLIATGPDPVIAFVMAKHSELTTLRTLLLGRLASLSKEALHQRVRRLGV